MNTADSRTTFKAFYFSKNDWVPNNERLPALLYPGGKEPNDGELAGAFETAFANHGWVPQWRAGVYHYHHYHSTAHEVLGCYRGAALLVLGGPGGRKIHMKTGATLVLPVGTGHCCVEASDDFAVVGAYPLGQPWDICTQAPTMEMARHMAALPLPDYDPLMGLTGAVISAWKNTEGRIDHPTAVE